MPYPKSDHFDGERFFSPVNNVDKGFLDFLKWKWGSDDKAAWPDWRDLEKQEPAKIPGPNQISTTYINHATHLIQMGGVNVLTDPIFSKRASPVSWAGPKRVHDPAIEINQLPKIHLVLISHNHYDHMDVDSIRKISEVHQPLFLVPLGNKALIEEMGAKNIVEIDWWEELPSVPEFPTVFASVRVTLVPVQHWSSRGFFDRNRALWGGFVLQHAGLKIFFAGDTGYGAVFSEIRKRMGIMDLSLLPIGAYEPRWFMKEQHMNPEDAVQAHIDLESKFTLGTHFGTFQLTDEGIDDPVNGLREALKEKSISESQFVAPKPGQSHLIGL